MHGHADLFRQRVVRDILAYLRLACNPGDRLALARALEAPPRGLGRLAAVLVDEPATTLVELPSLADRFGPAIKAGAAALVATVYALHADVARGGSPAVLLDRALDQTGYRAWLERHPDGPTRLRTVARLRAIAQRAEVGLGEWLDALAGGEDVDPVESDPEATRLSSIHTAKGREWRVVFLPGLEESVLPHYRALHGRDGGPDEAALEEELRVLYVASPARVSGSISRIVESAPAAATWRRVIRHAGCTHCRQSSWRRLRSAPRCAPWSPCCQAAASIPHR
jgi:DNA helicase-2/ATP-dependent DNA helicase PcrA